MSSCLWFMLHMSNLKVKNKEKIFTLQKQNFFLCCDPMRNENENVQIPTGPLTMEQRLWWMVQSIVPNFICPASWMDAFLSSGRSARQGGHHCREAKAADIEKISTGRHVFLSKVWRREVWLTTRNAVRAWGEQEGSIDSAPFSKQ